MPVAMKGQHIGAAALALLAGATLGACGSQTKTITAGPSGQAAAEGSSSSSTGSTGTAPSTTTTRTDTQANGGTPAPSTTRTAPEPAFAQGQEPAQQAKAAAAAVVARGYTPNDPSEYHPNQTLGVLVGTRTGSADGYNQQVFFFVDGRFIGTDTKDPSAAVKVVSQSDTEAVVSYALYRPNDPLSSPSAGRATVRFQLDNGHLMPVGKIPPVRSQQAPSRL
jgi:LppP/LprE lipoprotein